MNPQQGWACAASGIREIWCADAQTHSRAERTGRDRGLTRSDASSDDAVTTGRLTVKGGTAIIQRGTAVQQLTSAIRELVLPAGFQYILWSCRPYGSALL